MFTTKLVIVAFLTFKCIFSKTNVVHAANSLAKNTLAGQEHILGLTMKYEKRLQLFDSRGKYSSKYLQILILRPIMRIIKKNIIWGFL